MRHSLRWHARVARIARPLTAAAVLALALNIGALALRASNGATAGALACGLVSAETMYANNEPSIAYPIPVNAHVATDHPIGTFALEYMSGPSIHFREDLSHEPSLPPLNQLTLRWDFGDGTPPVNTPTGDLTAQHSFSKAGVYSVHFQILEPQPDPVSGSPWFDIDSAEIHVVTALLPNPPIARITASATAVVGSIGSSTTGQISFDASGSRPLVGSHLKYAWNFNDNGTATGARVTHNFAALSLMSGATFVTLVVTDDRGARSVATISIAVVTDAQKLPAATLSANTTNGSTGQAIAFDAGASTPDAQGDPLTQFNWDFGDGTQATTQNPDTSHVYSHTGTYRVAVQAVDRLGTPAQAVLLVTIGPPPPAWIPWAFGAVVALILATAIGWVVLGQLRMAREERGRRAAMELRRARRVPQGGVRPGDSRWGDGRGGNRTGATARTSAQRNARRGPSSGRGR